MVMVIDIVHVWMLLKTKSFQHSAFLVDLVHCLRDPQVLFFSKKNFKTGFHDTIHTFKNYFVTVFSIFSNKRYPNWPIIYDKPHFFMPGTCFEKYIGYKVYDIGRVRQSILIALIGNEMHSQSIVFPKQK